VRGDTRREELTVTTRAMSAVKSTKSDLESSRYTPTEFAFAEFFGGGSECLPFWRPLWPFSSIRFFEQEEE
jgi:hypothetical protein